MTNFENSIIHRDEIIARYDKNEIKERIHFLKVNDENKVIKIFGALKPTITKYKMPAIFFGEAGYIFETSNFGDVFLKEDMLTRVISRYIANSLDTTKLNKINY